MRDPPSQQFSVAESLEAADDCPLGVSKSRRKTPDVSLAILLRSVENGEVFHYLGGADRGSPFEVHVSFRESIEPAIDGVDGSGVFHQCEAFFGAPCWM